MSVIGQKRVEPEQRAAGSGITHTQTRLKKWQGWGMRIRLNIFRIFGKDNFEMDRFGPVCCFIIEGNENRFVFRGVMQNQQVVKFWLARVFCIIPGIVSQLTKLFTIYISTNTTVNAISSISGSLYS